MPLVDIIAPTYGQEQHTRKCFSSLADHTRDYRLIWVDNGSSEESRRSVQPIFERSEYRLPLWMGEGTAEQDRYRREFMGSLRQSPPDFIVVAPQAEPLVGRIVELEEFPELFAFIGERYVLDREIAGLVLYRLRAAAALP